MERERDREREMRSILISVKRKTTLVFFSIIKKGFLPCVTILEFVAHVVLWSV